MCNIGRGSKCCKYLSLEGDMCKKEKAQVAVTYEGVPVDCPGMKDLLVLDINIGLAYLINDNLLVVPR